jgi:hypothetical protein
MCAYGCSCACNSAVSGVVTTFLKQPMPDCDAISRAFASNNKAALAAAVEEHKAALATEQNGGLAAQVIKALDKHRIRRLSKCYISLTLDDIAARLQLADARAAESLLLSVLAEDPSSIAFKINSNTSLVSFGDAKDVRFDTSSASTAASSSSCSTSFVSLPEDAGIGSSGGSSSGGGSCGAQRASVVSIAQQLECHLAETMQLSEKLRDMQREVVTSRRYVRKSGAEAAAMKGIGGGGGGSSSSGMGGGMGVSGGAAGGDYDDRMEMY